MLKISINENVLITTSWTAFGGGSKVLPGKLPLHWVECPTHNGSNNMIGISTTGEVYRKTSGSQNNNNINGTLMWHY